MPLIAGPQLTPEQRAKVLAAFVHRRTIENYQERGASHPYLFYVNARHAVPPTETDAEWLASHAFRFTRSGQLALGSAQPLSLAEDVPPDQKTLAAGKDD